MLTGGVGSTIYGLTGCLSTPLNTPIATVNPGETKTIEGEPIQELHVHEFPEWVPFTGSVSVISQPSHTEVGVFRVTLQNQASKAWKLVTGHVWLPFPMDTSGGLIISEGKGFEQKNDCLLKASIAEGQAGREQFDSDETLQENRYLGTHEDTGECLPAGEHRFSNAYYTVPGDQEAHAEEDELFRWGFTLVLE
jgi:hypothetical protein